MQINSPLKRSSEYKGCFFETHGSTGSLTVLSDHVLYAINNLVYPAIITDTFPIKLFKIAALFK